MSEFLFLLVFILFVISVVGLIKPAVVIRWGSKRKRKQVLLYFTLPMIVLFFVFASTLPPVEKSATKEVAGQPVVGQPAVTEQQPVATETAVNTASLDLPVLGQSYTVVKVIDGDTLTIAINGKNETIRLIGIDTPETKDPRKPVQCFGQEATKKMTELVSGKKVTLEADAVSGERDKYNRLLHYIRTTDGLFVNLELIRQGYAYEYTYSGQKYKYQTEFKAAQTYAEQNKLGLWADDACISTTTPTAPITTTPTATNAPVSNTTTYNCSSNVYNCDSFKTQTEAQAAFDYCGGTSNDVHKLDRDGDGRVCESLN